MKLDHRDLRSYARESRALFEQAVRERLEALLVGGSSDEKRWWPNALDALHTRIAEVGQEEVIRSEACRWFIRLHSLRYLEARSLIPTFSDEVSAHELESWLSQHPCSLKSVDVLVERDEQRVNRLRVHALCGLLANSFPQLFAYAEGDTALCMPDVESSNSLLRRCTSVLTDLRCQSGPDCIGWLFQFYHEEQKFQVMGSVVRSEDIPAATQIFTPRWIIDFLLQNALSDRLPEDPGRFPYRHPGRVRHPTGNQSVERIRLLDPACGSGHMLLGAYDLFQEMYDGVGISRKDSARLILQKNLYGLDIDSRAVQLANFILTARAAEDLPELLLEADSLTPHVVVLVNSEANDVLTNTCAPEHLPYLEELLALFSSASTVGSLIQISPELAELLPELERFARELASSRNLQRVRSGSLLESLVLQARLLSERYDVVIGNPPYMGDRSMNETLRQFARQFYPNSKGDLCTMFLERALRLTSEGGAAALVVMESWMFLRTYQKLRMLLAERARLHSLVHMDMNVMGIAFGTSGVVFQVSAEAKGKGTAVWVEGADLDASGSPSRYPPLNNRNERANSGFFEYEESLFSGLPGAPLCYWLSPAMRSVFQAGEPLGTLATPKQGLATGENARFLRFWFEVDRESIGFDCTDTSDAVESRQRWFPYNKGGPYRKWYGNQFHVVLWEDDGREIKNFRGPNGRQRSRPQNTKYYFKPGISWTFVSASRFGVRLADRGFIFDVAGSSLFPEPEMRLLILGFLGSTVAHELLKAINSTLNFQVGDIAALPFLRTELKRQQSAIEQIVSECIALSRSEWNENELSWEFRHHPIENLLDENSSFEGALSTYCHLTQARCARLAKLESELNRRVAEAYSLTGEVACEVDVSEVTLRVESEQRAVLSYLSYFLGLSLGRYQPVEPMEVSSGFVPVSRSTGGIVHRLKQYLGVRLGSEMLGPALRCLGDQLCNNGQDVDAAIEHYYAREFFPWHVKQFFGRPIYWLVSSGPESAFLGYVSYHSLDLEKIVLLREEYVRPTLEALAGADRENNLKQEDRESRAKRLKELERFDERLKEISHRPWKFNLDDGIQANYQRLSSILAPLPIGRGRVKKERDV